MSGDGHSSELPAPLQDFPRGVRFYDLHLDLGSGDLQRNGVPLKLQPQAASVLVLLVSKAGQIVSREELARHLWPEAVVEFDLGINNVIRLLRRELGDEPQRPRFIATVPRRGYRFVAPLEACDPPAAGAPRRLAPSADPETARPPVLERLCLGAGRRLPTVLSGLAVAIALVALRAAPTDSAPGIPALVVLPFSDGEPHTHGRGADLAAQLTQDLSMVPVVPLRFVTYHLVTSVAAKRQPPLVTGRAVEANHVVVGSLLEHDRLLVLEVVVVRVFDGTELWRDGVSLSPQELLTESPKRISTRPSTVP